MNFWTRYPSRAGTASGSLIDWLIPGPCLLCGDDAAEVLCKPCRQSWLNSTPARCRQCASRLPTSAAGQICGSCLRHPPAFDASVVVCDYAAPLDQLVLTLKFGRQPVLARWIAAQLQTAILASRELPLPQLLCAVPLSQQRLRQRGYNQAHEIARHLAPLLGLPLQRGGLERIRSTAPQSELALTERQNNIRGAFRVSAGLIRQLSGRHIGVTDDVITTGLTLHEVATMLKKCGAARITNFVFARTPDPAHSGEA